MRMLDRPLCKATAIVGKSGLYLEVQPNGVCTGNQIALKKGDVLPTTERNGLFWRHN